MVWAQNRVYRHKSSWGPTGIGRLGVSWRIREDDQPWLPCGLSHLIASQGAVFPTLMRTAASRTVRPFLISIFARAIFSAVMTALRPPFRPRAVAALGPARVLSRTGSHSNRARAPNKWKTRASPLATVSMPSVKDLNPMPRLKIAHRVDQMAHAASETPADSSP